MADISFDMVTNDIVLINSDLCLTSDTDVTEGVRQDLAASLKTFQGEYFADRSVGVPWREDVLSSKPLSSETATGIVTAAVLGVGGVSNVNDVTIDFDRSGREMTVSVTCQTDEGTLIKDNIIIGV